MNGRLTGCILALLATGCGGGGGDSAPPSPPPPHLSSLPALTLSDSNTAIFAYQTFFSLTDLALSFAAAGVELVDLHQDPLQSTASTLAVDLCPEGGMAAASLDDRDGDGRAGTDDRITLTFSACQDEGVEFNGMLIVDIASLSNEGELRHVSTLTGIEDLRATAEGVTIRIDALITTWHQRDEASERYELTVSQLQVSHGNDAEGVFGLMLVAEHRFDEFRYLLSFGGRLASTLLGGHVDVSTPVPLAGEILRYPEAGRIEVEGGAGTRVAMTPGPPTSPNSMTRELVTGPGQAPQTSSVAWPIDLRHLWLEPLRPGVEPPPPEDWLVGRLVPLGAPGGDIVIDEGRDALYVTVPERNELVTLSLTSLQVTGRRQIAGQPQRMRLSQDGSTLYLTANQGGAVIALDLDHGALTRFEIANELGHGQVWDLVELAPGRLLVSGSRVATSTRGLLELNTGTGATTLVPGSNAVGIRPQFVYRPGDTHAYVRSQEMFFGLHKLDVQQQPAVLVGELGLGLRSPPSTEMAPTGDGSLLIQSTGQVVRSADLVIVSDEMRNALPAFSRNHDELWLWRIGAGPPGPVDRSVQVRDGQTLQPVGSWQPQCGDGNQLLLRHLQAGRWALLVGDHLCLVDTAARLQAPGAGDSAPPPPLPSPVAAAGSVVALGGESFDMAFDGDAGLAWVSLPDERQIAVVDARTGTVISWLDFADTPRGLALSTNRDELLVALEESRTIAVVDVATQSVKQTLATGDTLGNDGAWYVIDAGEGRLLVISSGGLARLALVPRSGDPPTLVGLIASPGYPQLFVAPDRSQAFLATTASALPAAIWTINLAAESLEPVLKHPVSKFSQGPVLPLAVSPDARRIYTAQGMVVSSETVMQVGRTSAGIPRPAPDGLHIMVATADGLLARFDAVTEVPVAFWETSCGSGPVQQLEAMDDKSLWVLRQGDELCLVAAP